MPLHCMTRWMLLIKFISMLIMTITVIRLKLCYLCAVCAVFYLPLQVRLHKEEGEDGELKGPVVFCMQAEHTGTRTYYFSADSREEQEEWIKAMSRAAEVQSQPAQRCCSHTCTRPFLTYNTDAMAVTFSWFCLIWPVLYVQSWRFWYQLVLFISQRWHQKGNNTSHHETNCFMVLTLPWCLPFIIQSHITIPSISKEFPQVEKLNTCGELLE